LVELFPLAPSSDVIGHPADDGPYHEEENDDENDDFHSHIIDYFSLWGNFLFEREGDGVSQA